MIHFLKLYNFRAFKTLQLDFTNNKILIYGKNNSGKTSILEALYAICNGHSFRSSDLKKLIYFDESFFSIEIVNDNSIKLMYGKDNGKHYFINDKKSPNTLGSAFICYNRFINDFIFTLEFRRGILDECISLLDQEYFMAYVNYRQYLNNKKDVIKSIKADSKQKQEYLFLLNKSISKDIEIMIKKRQIISKELTKFYKQFYDYSIEYKSQFLNDNIDLNLQANIEKVLNSSVEQEIHFQKSRRYQSDIFFLYHENHDIRSHGSYSTYKTIYFYTILYFLLEYKTQKDKAPLFLFDDFFNGIDADGQKRIFKSIADGIQVFFAQCEKFDIINKDIQFIEI